LGSFDFDPGGPAILNAVEKQLGLEHHKLQSSRQILADYGNISSSTCIYVLDHMRRHSLKLKEKLAASSNAAQPGSAAAAAAAAEIEPEWGFILAFGPGITIEGALARSLS
jgi:predicted naringenin-chalcone synthase